jgi:hypothetical protein
MMSEDLAFSKSDLAATSASKVVAGNLLRLLQRASRALLLALQDSRERTARKIIHDYRHLLDQ